MFIFVSTTNVNARTRKLKWLGKANFSGAKDCAKVFCSVLVQKRKTLAVLRNLLIEKVATLDSRMWPCHRLDNNKMLTTKLR